MSNLHDEFGNRIVMRLSGHPGMDDKSMLMIPTLRDSRFGHRNGRHFGFNETNKDLPVPVSPFSITNKGFPYSFTEYFPIDKSEVRNGEDDLRINIA